MRCKNWLLAAVLPFALTFAGCEPAEDNERVTASGKAADANLDDVIAQEPVVVTGSYLSCQFLQIPERSERSSVGCNPYDARSGSMIDLAQSADEVRWTYNSLATVNLIENYTDDEGRLWQARFDFENATETDLIFDTEIKLSYRDRDEARVVELSDRIRDILIELAAHRYIRIVYQSIHMNPPDTVMNDPDPVNFDFKIGDQWQPINIQFESIDVQSQTMSSDQFSFRFQGDPVDWNMYISSGMNDSFQDFLGSDTDLFKWSEPDGGGGWLFTEGSSFSNQAPYDVLEIKQPVFMEIDLGQSLAFHGFRIDQGIERPGRILPNGFPDRFYFMFSDDRNQWFTIPGSESTLTDRQALVWEWD